MTHAYAIMREVRSYSFFEEREEYGVAGRGGGVLNRARPGSRRHARESVLHPAEVLARPPLLIQGITAADDEQAKII